MNMAYFSHLSVLASCHFDSLSFTSPNSNRCNCCGCDIIKRYDSSEKYFNQRKKFQFSKIKEKKTRKKRKTVFLRSGSRPPFLTLLLYIGIPTHYKIYNDSAEKGEFWGGSRGGSGSVLNLNSSETTIFKPIKNWIG